MCSGSVQPAKYCSGCFSAHNSHGLVIFAVLQSLHLPGKK